MKEAALELAIRGIDDSSENMARVKQLVMDAIESYRDACEGEDAAICRLILDGPYLREYEVKVLAAEAKLD